MDKLLKRSGGGVTVTNDGATILGCVAIKNQIGRLIVSLSKSIDGEVGDGTTSVVLLACSLLDMAGPLLQSGLHPLHVARGYEVAGRFVVQNLRRASVKVGFGYCISQAVYCACMTTLGSKIASRCRKRIARLCLQAVISVADISRRDVNLDLIKVELKGGGRLDDTDLIDGMLLDKEISHPQMRRRIDDARIALLTCPFEPPKLRSTCRIEIKSSEQFEALRSMERSYFVQMVNQCKNVGASLIVCQWGFDDEANHLLMLYDLSAIRWVGGVEMELLSLATGSVIVSRFRDLNNYKLGQARHVREFQLDSLGTKVVVLEGCVHSRSVTIMVRGGSNVVLHEVERSIHDALCVASSLLKFDIAIYGGGSSEISSSLCVEHMMGCTNSVDHYALRSFANALDEIPLSLAANSGLAPVFTVTRLKSRHLRERNPFLGVDCLGYGSNDMREQNVLESFFGKKQQVLLAVQAARMVMRID